MWIALASAFVVLAVLGVLLGNAAVYQPVVWGDMSGPFPGLPHGIGIKVVNNFGGFGEDYYVPPQRGVFSFGVTIENSGSRPVTINGVTAGPPGQLVPLYNAVHPAGPVLYTTDVNMVGTPRVHVLHDLTLEPGETIFVGIPMRTEACAMAGGWTYNPGFYVREHFLFFSHTIVLPWTSDGARLIMHEFGPEPGQAKICAPQQGSTS